MNVDRVEQFVTEMPGFSYWLDCKNVILGCNDNFAYLLGRSEPEEIVGSGIGDLIDKKYLRRTIDANRKVVRLGKEIAAEERFLAKKNSYGRILLTQKIPVHDDAGGVIGVLSHAVEVTKYARREKKLKASVEHSQAICSSLESLIEIMPGNVYWKDRHGRTLGCNRNNLEGLSLSSYEQYLGKDDLELMGEEEGGKIMSNDQMVMDSGKEVTFEEVVTMPGKGKGTVLTKKIPMKDSSGKTIGILGISIDISKRKQEEKKLKFAQLQSKTNEKIRAAFISKLSEEVIGKSPDDGKSLEEQVLSIRRYLDHIISLVPGNVYWKNRGGVNVGCNDNSLKMLGLKSREDYIGKTYDDFFDQDHANYLRDIDEQIMVNDEAITIEEEAVENGKVKNIYLTRKVPLHDDDGQVIGLLGASIDITEQKQLQAELEETRLQVKTQEERTKAMQVLGASLAHELRTPLATISNYADAKNFLHELLVAYEMAKEAKLPVPFIRPMHIEALGESLVGIQKEATLASKIIDMLLTNLHDLAEAEKDYKKHSIVKCVNMAIERYPYVPDAQQKLVSFDVKNDFIVYGKDLLIMHILFNLMKNAFYYIEQAGKGEIKIHLELGEKVNKLIFTDTGSGIPEEQLPHVFDHFFSKRENGTGVGLTFSRMVMENLGGEMSCESKFGVYATFIMEFPVVG